MTGKYASGGIYVVQGEVSILVSAMRKVHWSARSYQEDENNSLLKNLIKLKSVLNQHQDLKEIELITFLGPFLDVIKSNETSVSVTILALSAVNKFISYGLIEGVSEKYILPVIENIANTVANANFITTDILIKIVEVSRTLVMSPLGRQLSNDSICNIMLRCFKICFETQLNEILRHSAEHCLKDVVQLLFSRLPEFIQTPVDEGLSRNKKLRIRSKGNEMNQNTKKKPVSPKVISPKKPLVHNDVIPVSSDNDQIPEAVQSSPSSQPFISDNDKMVMNQEWEPENTSSLKNYGLQSQYSIVNVADMVETKALINQRHHLSINSTDVTKDQFSSDEGSSISPGNEVHNTVEREPNNAVQIQSLNSRPVSPYSCPSDESGNKEYINSQGVRFMSNDFSSEDWLLAEYILEPHNSICVQELLRFLTVICNPYDKQNTDVMIHIGLCLLTIAVEVGADAISTHPTLLAIVKDTLCRNLRSLLNKEKMQIFTTTLHVSFLLFESMRCHLKFQMEFFLSRLTEIIISDISKVSYEKKELALECLVQLWRIPGLVTELFINYDCDLYCSNLYEDITKLLSKNVYPLAEIYSTHLLSLDILLTIIDSIESHCHTRISNEKVVRDQNSDSVNYTNAVDLEVTVPESNSSADEGQYVAYNVPNHEQLMAIKRKKKLLTIGTEYFNEKPAKGIQFLQERGLLSDPLKPSEVAIFLRENPHLDKKQIGDYVSHRSNLKILEQFVTSFDFVNLRIDEALRVYLEAFRLPGEAPLISEVLQQFADHWHKSNGEPFSKSDAAYVLAYAIIMLNVDQHNQVVRRQQAPMKLEHFKKNLKGTDDGHDFNQELLEEIYHSVKNQEIVMPAEQTGLVKENYLWEVMLRRGSGKNGFYIKTTDGVYDHELFSICWGPVMTALSYIFEKANDSIICNNCIQGFGKCATISAYYGMSNEFDNMTLTLCKFTTLVNSIENPESFTVSFGMNAKARLATRTVFELAHRHGDILRDGWHPVLSCIFQLFRCKLLPKILIEAEDFLELSGKVSLVREDVSNQKALESGLLSSLYSYITLAADVSSQRINNIEEQEYIEIAKDCIAKCRLENLVADSKFLRLESLQELLKALIRACCNADDIVVVDTKQDEDKVIFFLEMLLKVVLQNRDRINSLWSLVHNHLHALLMVAATSEQQFLIERCVTGLLGLAVRLTRRDEISSEVLQSLRILLLLKWSTLYSVSRQISYGLYELLKTGAANIHTEADWDIIFTLFEIVGAGAPLPKIARSIEENGKSEDITAENATEDSGFGYDKAYLSGSDTSLNQQSLFIGHSSCNSYILWNDDDECNNASHFYSCNQLLPHDPFSLVKCYESLAFLVRDVAHITPFNYRNCVRTMRTFVEATFYTSEGKIKEKAANNPSKTRSRSKPSTTSKKWKVPGSKNQSTSYNADESDPEEYPDSYFQVPLQLLDLMHTLHTKTADIHSGWTKENAEQEVRSLWLYGWRPLLRGIARLCCDPRKTVRMSAITYLQRALLMHDLQKLRASEWESCFNYVLFPLLDKLAKPFQGKDSLGVEETRTRAATLLSKVFLHHLSPLQTLFSFTNLWLRILEFMNCYMNLDKKSDLLNEAIHESVKNMILVMKSAKLFSDQDSQFWNLTWERVNKFIPNLREELSRYHSAVHEKGEEYVPNLNSPDSPPSVLKEPRKMRGSNATNSQIDIVEQKQEDVSLIEYSVAILPHMGKLISTPIGPPDPTNDMEKPNEPCEEEGNSHTQISSLIASAPEFLASLPSLRAQSPPILTSNVSPRQNRPGYLLPEMDHVRPYPISTPRARECSPGSTATTPPDPSAFPYIFQRSSSVCEASVSSHWTSNIATEMRTESFPVLSRVPPSNADRFPEQKREAADDANIPVPTVFSDINTIHGSTPETGTMPDVKLPEAASHCSLKLPFPVYSGFSHLNRGAISNIEDNSATQFFYQNWSVN